MARTKQIVNLEDASKASEFGTDVYLAQTGARSRPVYAPGSTR